MYWFWKKVLQIWNTVEYECLAYNLHAYLKLLWKNKVHIVQKFI
jgi:hypothetical protein